MGGYLDMGGYAGFVWPSYIIAALVLGGLFAASWRGLKARRKQLAQLQAVRDAALGRRRAARTEEKDTP